MKQDFLKELEAFISAHPSLEKEEFTLKSMEFLSKASAEIKGLLEKIHSAVESEKHAYERLADIDISRHVEVSDLKQDMEKLRAENEKLMANTLSSIKTIDRLQREIEIKKLQLTESEKNLSRTASALKEKTVSEALHPLAEELPPAYPERLEALSSEIEELKKELEDRTGENLSLQNGIAHLKGMLDEKDKEMEVRRLRYENEIKRLAEEELGRYTSEMEKLKTKRAEIEKTLTLLKEQKDREISGHLAGLKSLSEERDDLNRRLKEVNSEVVSLKSENEELLKRLSHVAGEMDGLRGQKAEDITSMRAQLDASSEKITDLIGRLQGSISDNLERLEQLTARQMEFYPAVIPDKQKKPERKTGRKAVISLKRTAVVAVVVVFLLIGGFLGIYAVNWLVYTDRPMEKLLSVFKALPEPPQIAPAPPPEPPPPPPVKTEPPWSGSREVVHEDFTATLTYLTPDLMDNFGVPAKVSEEEKTQNFFYALEITAQKGYIPDEVVNFPSGAVSFINENGHLLKPVDIPDLSASKKVIYKIKPRKKGQTGAVLLRYFMAVSRTHSPEGAVIEGLIKNYPLIIK